MAALAVVYDHPNGDLQVPNADPFNTSFSFMGVANAALGVRIYKIEIIQGLAFSLGRRDPGNPPALDGSLYGVDGLEALSSYQVIVHAVNNGFVHGVTPTGNTMADGHCVIRAAQRWAQNSVASLRIVSRVRPCRDC